MAVNDVTSEKEFKQAVEDELVCIGIWNDTHTNARKAVADIVQWHMEVALDPLVSKEARDLIAKGATKETLEETQQRFEAFYNIDGSDVSHPYDPVTNTYPQHYTKQCLWAYWQEALRLTKL